AGSDAQVEARSADPRCRASYRGGAETDAIAARERIGEIAVEVPGAGVGRQPRRDRQPVVAHGHALAAGLVGAAPVAAATGEVAIAVARVELQVPLAEVGGLAAIVRAQAGFRGVPV